MQPPKVTPKAEETGRRILEAALELFRQEGFDTATMRDIARKAEVATGAAYYYYPSKDAIVMDFYQRSCAEMQPKIEAALEHAAGLETRLRELIRVKLAHFAPIRGAAARTAAQRRGPQASAVAIQPANQGDPGYRPGVVSTYLVDCGMRIPRDLEPPARRALVLSNGRNFLAMMGARARESARGGGGHADDGLLR